MSAVQRYQQRISGPLMDRVDIHLEMVRVPFQKLASLEAGESSSAIRARVETARKVQEARFRKWGKPGVMVNGDMGPAEVQQFCDIDEAGRNLMRAAMQQMNLSARAYHRILKLGLRRLSVQPHRGRAWAAHLDHRRGQAGSAPREARGRLVQRAPGRRDICPGAAHPQGREAAGGEGVVGLAFRM